MIVMKKKADIVIIGGGINGCCLAYNLSKKGLNVQLVEKNYLSSGATGSCGAGIRQQWSTEENTLLAIESVKIFENLSKELGEDIEFRQGGYLIAIHDKAELNEFEKNVKMQKSLGLDVDIIDKEKIKKIVPILDIDNINAICASFCPTDGHANPFKTTFSYAKSALKYDTDIATHTKVLKILSNNKKITEVKTDKGNIKTNTVINSAGVWSKEIAKMVNIKIPNQALRKEILATERMKEIFKAMVISFKDGIYFSQPREGQIVGGIPLEKEFGLKTLPTIDFLHHMSTTLTRYAPCLKHVKVLRHWTGFYDMTPDARPIIDETKDMKGFIHCHGFSGHGFMLSPMVAKILTEYIVDNKKDKILDNLSLDRFKGKKIKYEKSVVG